MSTKNSKSVVYRIISDNIKSKYGIKLFKMLLFPDGSGCIWALDGMYNEINQVFSFSDVGELIEEFI
jgi:hypothetical protein